MATFSHKHIFRRSAWSSTQPGIARTGAVPPSKCTIPGRTAGTCTTRSHPLCSKRFLLDTTSNRMVNRCLSSRGMFPAAADGDQFLVVTVVWFMVRERESERESPRVRVLTTGHLMHISSLGAPVSVLYVPAPHSRHVWMLMAPVDEENVPTGQGTQSVGLSAPT